MQLLLHGCNSKTTSSLFLAAISTLLFAKGTCFSSSVVPPPPSAAASKGVVAAPSSKEKETNKQPPAPLASPSSSSSSSSSTSDDKRIIPWAHARLDYSATNGFLKHYYGIENYFDNHSGDGKPEPVYNARLGALIRNGANAEEETFIATPTLDTSGFTLVHAPGPEVDDWQDLEAVRDVYLPRARHALLQAYTSTGHTVKDVIFWKPTYRSGPTSYVSPVHIDMDVNAYQTADDLLDFCWSCRVPDNDSDATQRQMWKQALEQGARFHVTNVWHNVRPDLPAHQGPMGLLRTYYDDNCQLDEFGLCPADYDAMDEEGEQEGVRHATTFDAERMQSWPALPFARPSPAKSRWYTFPAVTSDELLLFTQYDRDVRTTTDVWHCALTDFVDQKEQYANRTDDDARNRHSFDMRCLVLLDEMVPTEWDRWTPAHQLPMRPEALAEE